MFEIRGSKNCLFAPIRSKIPAGEDDESSKVTKICLEEEYVDAEAKVYACMACVIKTFFCLVLKEKKIF